MAVVGEAHIIVRALTDKVAGDIQRGFSGTGSAGRKAGESMGKAFSQGFNRNANANVFTKFADGIRSMVPEAEGARVAFRNLMRAGYVLQTALGVILGALGSLVGGLGALGGAALGAGASLASLGTIFASLGMAMLAAKLALSGVGKALAALNKPASGGGGAAAAADAAQREAAARRVEDAERALAEVIEQNREDLIDANNEVRDSQLELNRAIKEGQEAMQQLGFDAEEAALAEGRAALELDKARETLARTQDLPPNSRARKEAELAFQEAELRLRQAKDRSADLNKEQDRLARTGVAGTEQVISANQRLAQSEANKAKVVRDAARKQADAERELARARADAITAGQDSGGGGGGSNPFEGLNQFQIDFVNNLQTLKDELDAIKLSVAGALLPNLWTAIDTLAKGLFDTVKNGLTEVATATGLAAIDFADMVVEGRNVAALGTLFTNSSKIILQLGDTAGRAYGIALSLLNAAFPAADRFVKFLNNKLLSFDEYLKAEENQTKIQQFFQNSENYAARFGGILGNIFNGIGDIILANFGEGSGGDIILDSLERATSEFANLRETGIDGVGSLSIYFQKAAENATSVIGAVSALVQEILKLGANENIGKTFDILAEGAPLVGKILEAGINAGPAFADLIYQLTRISEILADTGALETFFNVLGTIAKSIADFLDNDTARSILDTVGRVFAFISALGLIGTIGAIGIKILLGNIALLSSSLGGLFSVMGGFAKNGLSGGLDEVKDKFGKTGSEKDKFIGNLQKLDGQSATTVQKTGGGLSGMLDKVKGGFATAGGAVAGFAGNVGSKLAVAGTAIGGVFSSLGTSLLNFGKLLGAFMLSPAGIVIGIIALIVGGLILLYNTSEEFRVAMDAAFAELSATFAQAGADIMAAITPLIPLITGAMTQIMTSLAPLIPMLIQGFMQIVQAILPLVTLLISSLVPAIIGVITAVVPLITMLISSLVPVIIQVINAFIPLITMLITSLVPVIVTIIEAFVPLITMLITTLVPVIIQVVEAFVPLITMLIESLVPVIIAVVEAFVPLITTLVEMLVPVITLVIEIIAALIPPFIAIVTTILNIVVPVIQFLLEIFITVVTGIINFVVGFVTFIIEAFTNISNFWNEIWTAIVTFVSDVWNNMIQFITDAWNNIYNFVKTGLDSFFSFWSTIFTNVGNFISDTWNNIVKFFRDGWNTVWNWILTAVSAYVNWWLGVFRGVGNFISDTWNNIVKFFRDGWNMVYNWISGAVNNFVTFWRGIFSGVGNFIGDTWTNIMNFFKTGWNTVYNWIKGAIDNFVGFWKGAFQGISDFVGGIFGGLGGIIKAPINAVVNLINGAIGGINNVKFDVPDWVPIIGGKKFGFNIPKLPQLAMGGIVSPQSGGTLAQIAEAGRPERVEPLDANGMSKRDRYMVDLIKAQQGGAATINITVNPSAGMDESELAAAISREITFQMRRGAVA